MTSSSRLVLLGLVAAFAGGCGDEGTEPTDRTVQVEDDVFNPASASVDAGATVTWSWSGANPHSVTFIDPISGGGTPPTSATQTSGSYQLTFNNAGSFDYYCTIHGQANGTGMAGTINVQ